MSSALDQFERSLVTASRALHALEQSAPTPTESVNETRRRRAARRPKGRSFRPRRLMISLVALVVAAGGVATAQSLLWPSQRLADGKVNCFLATYGRGISSKIFAIGDVRLNGQLPISMCRRLYRLNRYRLERPERPRWSPIFRSSLADRTPPPSRSTSPPAAPTNARRLGEKPLPATYATAAARLRALQRTLVAVQAEHDCVSPNTSRSKPGASWKAKASRRGA